MTVATSVWLFQRKEANTSLLHGLRVHIRALQGCSRDEKNVDDYIADPLCGFRFSVGGYEAVLSLTKEAANAAKASHVPKSLP